MDDTYHLEKPNEIFTHHINRFKNSEQAKRKQSINIKLSALSTISSIQHFADTMEYVVKKEQNHRYWYRFAVRSSLPETPPNELIRRSAFLLMSSMTCFAGLIWGVMYMKLNEPSAAFYPFTYSFLMSTCFIFFIKEGRYHNIVFIQLLLTLLLPIFLQIEVGGIVKSGGVVIWSFLCPLGAALFCRPFIAKRWFSLYIITMIVTLSSECWHPRMILERRSSSVEPFEIALFTMNLAGAMTITYFGALTFSARLVSEYKRSENLLHNVLPRSIVKRLKDGEYHIIDHFEGVSILFADLVGFTVAAAEFNPNFLIGMFLRDVFSEWDELCEQHSMEKIKTIGDAFMAVGGIDKNGPSGADVAVQMVLLGIEMQKSLIRINRRYKMKFKCRLGLHSGPVIAGVIGVRKFAFDVWGDAVNTASRMESHGIPGYLQLSSSTYGSVKHFLSHIDIKCRGDIEVKGKGLMETYLIKMPEENYNYKRRDSDLESTSPRRRSDSTNTTSEMSSTNSIYSTSLT